VNGSHSSDNDTIVASKHSPMYVQVFFSSFHRNNFSFGSNVCRVFFFNTISYLSNILFAKKNILQQPHDSIELVNKPIQLSLLEGSIPSKTIGSVYWFSWYLFLFFTNCSTQEDKRRYFTATSCFRCTFQWINPLINDT